MDAAGRRSLPPSVQPPYPMVSRRHGGMLNESYRFPETAFSRSADIYPELPRPDTCRTEHRSLTVAFMGEPP